jgi:hypothetical protein
MPGRTMSRVVLKAKSNNALPKAKCGPNEAGLPKLRMVVPLAGRLDPTPNVPPPKPPGTTFTNNQNKDGCCDSPP